MGRGTSVGDVKGEGVGVKVLGDERIAIEFSIIQ